MPAYDKTYLKAKVREFDDKIKTKFLGNEVPKKYALYLHCMQVLLLLLIL